MCKNRFSKIVNSQRNKPAVQQTSTLPQARPSASNASVFSRLRGAKPVMSRMGKPNNAIQSRLGGRTGGGIRKKAVVVSNKRVIAAKRPIHQKKKGSLPQKKKVVKKPATAEDLDRALDDYMMKDPKSMKTRLDDDIESYMAEAEDILMDENLS